MFQNVRSLVTLKSDYKQTPWESTSLIGNFYFYQGISAFESSEMKTLIPSDQLIVNDVNELTDSVGHFFDIRDGESYKWIRIGEQYWMTENLKYKSGKSISTKDKGEFIFPVSQLYNWDDAQNVCPEGWHLPTDDDWIKLERHIGMSSTIVRNIEWRGTDEANKLKSIEGWNKQGNGIDEFGFNVLPVGYFQEGVDFIAYAYLLTTRIKNIGLSASFWAANDISSKSGYYRMLNAKKPTIYRGDMNKSNMCSIRCIKD